MKMNDDKSTGIVWRICLAVFCLLLIFLGRLVWLVVDESNQAEHNLHYACEVTEMIESFVQDNCRWPKSWDDLEPYRLKKVQSGNYWARDLQEMVDRVQVRFDFDSGLPKDEDFTTDPPIQPHAPYYRSSFEVRIELLRDAISNCQE